MSLYTGVLSVEEALQADRGLLLRQNRIAQDAVAIDESLQDYIIAVAEQTRPLEIPTLVSLNTIMVDGTGMCGGCRVRVGGENRFVCVDGPEFDAHQVDFDRMMQRQRIYLEQEEAARRRFLAAHECRATASGG